MNPVSPVSSSQNPQGIWIQTEFKQPESCESCWHFQVQTVLLFDLTVKELASNPTFYQAEEANLDQIQGTASSSSRK